MKRAEQLASRLREVLLDGHWVAKTNCREQIQGVDWQQAIRKVGDLNTIAVLVFHLNYYMAGLLEAMETGVLSIRDKYSFDAPDIQSESDWEKRVSSFLENAEKLIQSVARMEDSELDQPFIEERYGSFSRNIEGVIEHSYYHMGQMSLIRKMIKQG